MSEQPISAREQQVTNLEHRATPIPEQEQQVTTNELRATPEAEGEQEQQEAKNENVAEDFEAGVLAQLDSLYRGQTPCWGYSR